MYEFLCGHVFLLIGYTYKWNCWTYGNCFSLLGTARLFSQESAPSTLPLVVHDYFSTSSPVYYLFVTVILACVKWYLVVVLICISLIVSIFFMYLLAIYTFLEEMYTETLCPFLTELFVFLIFSCKFFKHTRHKSLIRSMICKIFSHSVDCLVFLYFSFKAQKFLILMMSNFFSIFEFSC